MTVTQLSSSMAGTIQYTFPISEQLILLGTNLESRDKDDRTPLMLESERGHLEVVKLLMKYGANVKAEDKRCYTALSIATFEVIEFFLDYGIDINTVNSNEVTILMLESMRGNLKMVKYLVEHGADVNARDCAGETALIYASSNESLEIVKFLVEHDVNVDERTVTSISLKYPKIAKYLGAHITTDTTLLARTIRSLSHRIGCD